MFLLQRIPFFVFAGHLFVELTPATFFGFEINPSFEEMGGRQILQGDNPCFEAFSKSNEEETFLTILQLDKWYFAPEGVL